MNLKLNPLMPERNCSKPQRIEWQKPSGSDIDKIQESVVIDPNNTPRGCSETGKRELEKIENQPMVQERLT